MWDNAAEALDTFGRDDFVRVKGLYQIFQNRPQLTVHKIAPVADAEVDFGDYFPASKRDRDEMFRELRSWIATDHQSASESAARRDVRMTSGSRSPFVPRRPPNPSTTPGWAD